MRALRLSEQLSTCPGLRQIYTIKAFVARSILFRFRILEMRPRPQASYILRRKRPLTMMFMALTVVLTGVVHTNQSIHHISSVAPSIASKSGAVDHGITIFQSHWTDCTGNFTSVTAPESESGLPYAMLRDVGIDRRCASIREYARSHKDRTNFVRIVLFISVHISVSLNIDGINASFNGYPPTARLDAVKVRRLKPLVSTPISVDHVLHINRFLLYPGKYVPGERTSKTIHNREVSDWQVILSISNTRHANASHSPIEEILIMSAQAGGALTLNFNLERYDSKIVSVPIIISLACITGLSSPALGVHPDPFLSNETCLDGAGRAIALVGSGLHGRKRDNVLLVREVAHFAARSLIGAVQFDAVLIPIIYPVSRAEAIFDCKGSIQCLRDHETHSRHYVAHVAKIVQDELRKLLFPDSYLRKVILMPICRLGTAFNGVEKQNPCAADAWNGQYLANSFPYSTVGSRFRWAASLDIDEFMTFRDHPSSQTLPVSASKFFDSLDVRDVGVTKLVWLNFRVDNSSFALSKEVLSYRQPTLVNTKNGPFDCYAAPNVSTFTSSEEVIYHSNGKVAVRCDKALGVLVHQGIMINPTDSLDQWYPSDLRAPEWARTWHARGGSSRSDCVHVASPHF
jgi:hypothetical protein